MKHFLVLILAIIGSLGLGARGAAETPDNSAPTPVRVLSIQERDEKGNVVPNSCSTAAASCSVDVASRLTIVPNLAPLNQRLSVPAAGVPRTFERITTSLTQAQKERLNEEMEFTSEVISRAQGVSVLAVKPPPLGESVREQREAIKEALAALTLSASQSQKLKDEHEKWRARDFAKLSADDARRISELSRAFEKQRFRAYSALLRYAKADPSAFDLTARDLADDNDALEKINKKVSRAELGEWLAARIQESEQQAVSNATKIMASAPSLSLRLGAFRIRRGKTAAVHLPGYDSFAAGVPRTFERITTSLTDAQKERLSEETQFNSDVIAGVQGVISSGKKVSANLEKTRREIADGLATARAELRVLLPTLNRDVLGELQKLRTDLAANQASAQQAAAIASVQKTAESLTSTLSSLQGAVEKLQTLSAGAGTSADRPDRFFLELLAGVDSIRSSTASTFKLAKTIPDTVKSIRSAVDSLATSAQFQQVVAADLAELRQTLERDIAPSADKVLASLGSVGALFEEGSGLFALVKNEAEQLSNAEALAKLDLSSPSIFSVPENQVQPTELAILETDAGNGDLLEIVAEVRSDKQKEPIQEERWSVTVRTFGWSSDVSGGLVFVKSIQVDTSNFKPEPAASWRIGYRARPSDSSFGAKIGRFLAPGVGIHVLSLDFASDVTVEMGAGVNLHLFSDLVQAGYGWNLTVKEKRSYWYLGIGLFELLKAVR